MKFIIGLLISFAVGVSCRFFDIPVGSPAAIPGALLVVAMTMGYSSANALLNRRNQLATTSHLCGGPTGAAVESVVTERADAAPSDREECSAESTLTRRRLGMEAS
jgi:XapX domain-containing protein